MDEVFFSPEDKKLKKNKIKHLVSWQSKRSVVGLMKNTKEYHMHLTTLSDQKANIVIAASSIIISVGISQIRNFEGLLLTALTILMVGASTALLFAILSVTPLFNKQTSKMTPYSKGFNPFFFGHFTDLSLDEYTEYMMKIMKDEDAMYTEMIKDLYQMGLVLRLRKYKFLGWSYRIFFLGILGGLITAIVAFL